MLELVLRLGFSLAAVLGLFWLVAHFGARRLGGGPRALLQVRARQSLSRTASVAVVEVGDKVLVVGVADGGVRLLTELDPASLPAAPTRVSRDGEAAGDEGAHDLLAAAMGSGPARLTDRLAAVVAVRLQRLRAGRSATPALPGDVDATVVEEPSAASAGRPAAAVADDALQGSVLSAQTWKQAWETATGRSASQDVPTSPQVLAASHASGPADG